NNCIINNASGIGLYATNYRIDSENILITNCGQYNFLVSGGGIYNFNHATIANYWSGANRQTPTIFAQNYYQDVNGNIQVRNIDSLNFKNSIIYGNIDNEFALETYAPGNINYNVSYSVIKTTFVGGSNFNNIVLNPAPPLFVDELNNDFH